ncbi:MAG: hypothetical protein NT040_18890 [Bacteroidetes bacterium]|nr:hypothetical protein [Bacteroidota bacterium]
METNPDFNKYMDRYFTYSGQWDSPSICGLKVINRNDGKILAIATEIYRQNPGTPVTEWCAPLATQIMSELRCPAEKFIFIEHTPDMGSKLTFYGETFDLVTFNVDGKALVNPTWSRLLPEQVDEMMEA